MARRDLEDSSKHVKTLEKQMKGLTQERDDLHKVEQVFHLCELCEWTGCFVHVHLDTVPMWLPVFEKLATMYGKNYLQHQNFPCSHREQK